jgi:biotin transport system substrate-specific component
MSTHAAPLPRTVLADALISRRTLVTDAALVLGGTLFVGAMAQLTVPLWPVPVTGQTLAVLLVGASLGATRGTIALALYALIGVLGVPVFTGFSGGVGMLTAPSFGYVIGFIPAAYLAGLIGERRWDRSVPKAIAGFSAVSVIPFLIGVPFLAVALGQLGVPNDPISVLNAGVFPFILGGLVKALLAALVVPAIWRGVRNTDRARG